MRIAPKKRTYDFMFPFMKGAICNKSKSLIVYMLYEQSKVNPININVFIENFGAWKFQGGFDWEKSSMGFTFWDNIIRHRRFDFFFERYKQ